MKKKQTLVIQTLGWHRLYCPVCLSLALTIEDQDGQPVDNANISYTVDGEAGTYVEYFTNGEYFVGGEETGDFEVDIYVEIPAEDCLILEMPFSMSP